MIDYVLLYTLGTLIALLIAIRKAFLPYWKGLAQSEDEWFNVVLMSLFWPLTLILCVLMIFSKEMANSPRLHKVLFYKLF